MNTSDTKYKTGQITGQITGKVTGQAEHYEFPVSFAQQRLWFLDQLEGSSAVYNIRLPVLLKGELDVDCLQSAVDQVVARHETLRTRFQVREGVPVQVISEQAYVGITRHDMSVVSTETLQKAVGRLAAEPFDLSSDSLFRVHLLRLSDHEHLLLLLCHHIISDAWSSGILFRDLAAAYDAGVANGQPEWPELTVQYADYTVWQRTWLEGPELERQLQFWREALKGVPAESTLSPDFSRPTRQSFNGSRHAHVLPEALATDLTRLAQSESCTLFMLLFAVFNVLIFRYTGQDDLCIGSPIAGRRRSELEGLVGLFVNTLVLRTDLSGDPCFTELLAQVRKTALAGFGHQELPFEKLVEALQPERDASRSPLFQIMFILQNAPWEARPIKGLEVEPGVAGDTTTSKFDVTVAAHEYEGELWINFEYNTDLFEVRTIEQLGCCFESLLRSVVAAPDTSINDLSLLSESMPVEQSAHCHGVQKNHDPSQTIADLIAAQIKRSPDAVAIESKNCCMTYTVLDQRAQDLSAVLAKYLKRIHPAAGSPVIATCTHRSTSMVTALASVLRAGAVYLPLDPAYPADRIDYMLKDAGAGILITQSDIHENLSGFEGTVVLLDEQGQVTDVFPASSSTVLEPNVPATVEQSSAAAPNAYLIYTSGSTGQPKGVVISQRSVVNFLLSMAEEPGLSAGDRLLAVTTPSFDIAVLELFLPLIRGGTVIVAESEVVADGHRLAALIESSRPTIMQATPATWRMLVNTGWQPDSSLRILCGGEALDPGLARQLTAAAGEVWNMYGPTETTIWSTCALVDAQATRISIGKPIANTSVYVLDARMQPVPVGVCGELYIGGEGVAEGYHNRDVLTAERFVADPFKAGGRLYRTGDRARYLHNGSLELLGRLDRQIKLRGFRIELGEIEAVLSQQPGISAAAVTVQNAHNDQRLVAYVVPSSAALDTEKLRANIRQVLPDYMIPSLFMQLDALPLTPNGKVDRHRLPAPDWHQAVSAHHVPPRGAVESALAGLYGELLGVTGVGAHDSFFDLGGHSLLATQLVSRIRDALDVELPLRALFDDPTVAGLAKVIQQQSGQAQADKSADQFLGRKNKLLPRSAKYQHAAPASFMQQRLWVLDLLEPGSGVYNLAWALHLGGELNLNVLQNAVNALVRRHQSLRTSMVNADGSPQQVIAEQATISIIAERTSSSGTKALLSQLNARAAVPFDLSDGPLLRVHVLEQGNNDHVLLLVIHHIIADGWSMSVLFNELSQAYNALLSGSSPDWPALPVQYADYSVWQRDWLSGAELERQTKFWQQQLAGAPPRLALPLDRPRPALQSHRGARLSRQLPASLQSGLVDLAREASGTLFMVLVAAFDAVMARYSGSEDIVIGTPVAGRSRTELEGLIGFFVNTLVLRTDLGGNPTFAELIARVRQTALDAYAHQDLPFEKLVDVLNVERDTGVTPVFQVMFNLHNEPVRSISLDDITATPIGIDRGFSKFDMTVSVSETSQGLFVHIEYNSDLFFVETIEGLLDDYTSVLNAVVTDPSVRLSDLLSSDAGGAEAAASPWTEATVAERFATQVVQTPKAIAVRTPRSARSYGALDEQANGIAHALRARVNKSDGYAPRVGLLCRQDLLLPAGMLGILKAGCVWVPLDPSWPQARLQAIAVDAGLTAIVADYPHQSLAASLNVAVVDLDVPARLDAPDVTPNADDLACIIYTSGSTGKPKGVMQTHRGLLLQAMRYSQSLDIQAGDRLSLLSSYAYDAAIQDVFGALLNGATLCPLSVRDGETLAEQTALVKTLVDLSVTVVHATPSLYRYLFGGELTCADDLSAVRRVVLGGEAVRRSDFELYRSRFTAPCQFINGLGLTESTLGVQFCADHETRLLGQSVPIGTAVSGLSVELRDEAGEPGWLGEIVLHGEGLSPGYWGEALRAEPNVLHTGDLGRRLPDGQIVYMGRRDHQVKLRGYRVEPGEVEARINALEGVTDCAVTVVERSGESWLVAYIESAGIAASDATSAPSLAKWRTQLSGQLPGYMVPQSFEGIESLPRLANGKVDYRQLPAPRFGRVLDESLVPARTELESRLQAIWQDVLQVETLGVHDDFFAMGGHSLLATRLIARVRDQLQLEVPLISLFEHPTIAGMAENISVSGYFETDSRGWNELISVKR